MELNTCMLWLRPVGEVPGGLWSWRVYVDGNVHARGPGSKRRDPVHWYATLSQGNHRLVVRDSETNNVNCKESNTLYLRWKINLKFLLMFHMLMVKLI